MVALFSGHRRGVEVGVAQLERGQMTVVSVSIPVVDLARGAERGGWSGAGRVVVWLVAARRTISDNEKRHGTWTLVVDHTGLLDSSVPPSTGWPTGAWRAQAVRLLTR